jgi:hypothetical protein
MRSLGTSEAMTAKALNCRRIDRPPGSLELLLGLPPSAH